MIEVTVAYPGQGRTFNMDYYLKTHIRYFKNEWARDENHSVSRGIAAVRRGHPCLVAVVHATFDSAEVFATAFAHTPRTQGDARTIPIFTVVQISEVLMGKPTIG